MTGKKRAGRGLWWHKMLFPRGFWMKDWWCQRVSLVVWYVVVAAKSDRVEPRGGECGGRLGKNYHSIDHKTTSSVEEEDSD